MSEATKKIGKSVRRAAVVNLCKAEADKVRSQIPLLERLIKAGDAKAKAELDAIATRVEIYDEIAALVVAMANDRTAELDEGE